MSSEPRVFSVFAFFMIRFRHSILLEQLELDQFARTERFMERVQCEFEADQRKEDWTAEMAYAGARRAVRPCAWRRHIEFLQTRAELLEDLGRHDDAYRDLTLALQQHPQRASILASHSRQLARQKRYQEAAAELITLRLLDPVDPRHVENASHVIQGLVYEGNQARMAGDFSRAIQLFSTALQCPTTSSCAEH